MSSSVEIDPELAKRLFAEAATLVLVDVPAGTEIGVDLKSWFVEEKFLGVKMIPPGLHYVHYSATNSYGDTAPRCGFIYNFKRKEIVVRKWDKEKEEIICKNNSEEETERVRDNLLNIDRFMGVYPFETYTQWKSLTNKINLKTFDRFIPLSGQIRSALDLVGSTDKERKEASTSDVTPQKRQRRSGQFTDEQKDTDLLPELTPVAGTELRLTQLPNKSYPDGSSPSDITKYSLDSSYVLEAVLSQYENPTDILSEVQFTFVCFLIGHSLDAFEQWKKLVGVLCSCDEALPKYTSIYLDLLTVLNTQLQEVPQDFLVDIVASNNFIYKSLKILFRTIQESSDNDRLRSKALRFRESLTQSFGWDFGNVTAEEDDERPVVVEL